MKSGSDKFYCYIYEQPNTGKVLYVGYATDASRAYTDGHNEEVQKFVESDQKYTIKISGPYRDEEEARNVEAALVSLLKPPLNLIDQPGNRFRPLGIPQEYANRRSDAVLDAHEIGRLTGGCIVVYCNLTSELKSGHSKVGPTSFSDDVVLNNIRGHWAVKKFLPQWRVEPNESPSCLVAVQGPPNDRIVIASAAIDSTGWAKTPAARWDPHLFEIPLRIENGLDNNGLRGRKVNIKFGAGTSNCTMVVDGTGLVLHGYRIRGKRNATD